jgi:hypothetical protein
MASLDSMAVWVDEPEKMVIKHPVTELPLRDKEGKEAFLMLLGTDSKAAHKHRREATARFLAKRNRNTGTPEEIDASAVEQLVALTKGWHLVNFEGEVIDHAFNEANARALYTSKQFAWLREQADAFIGDRANFLKSSETA